MPNKSNLRLFELVLLIIFAAVISPLTQVVHAQGTQVQSIPADSSRWELEGQARVDEYQKRKSLLLDGGAATLKDLQMRDAVIDVDVATPAKRGFFGIQFRLSDEGANGEWVYLRQHTDSVSGRSAQYFRDPGFLGIVNPDNDAIYLPLRKGHNELMLAVSEIGGGWGFICRLTDFEN